MTGANSNCFETLCRMTWHPLAYCSVSAYRIDTDSGIMCCYHVECATLWLGESMDHSHDHAQLPWLEPRTYRRKLRKESGFANEPYVRTDSFQQASNSMRFLCIRSKSTTRAMQWTPAPQDCRGAVGLTAAKSRGADNLANESYRLVLASNAMQLLCIRATSVDDPWTPHHHHVAGVGFR